MSVKELAQQNAQYVIDMRREFHAHPEASLHEVRTSTRILEELTKMGIPCERVADTGVVAVIQGAKPGKTIALRADIDALAVQECTGLPFQSTVDGLMHACGHDGHAATLLGAAYVLNQLKSEINGTVKLCFQPAEENGTGAKKMIADGVLDGVDGVFAIHLWSDLEAGKISVEPGPRMSSAGLFTITITGKGGHGSLPHQGIDAVTSAASFVMDVQTLVSRELSPVEPNVLTIGTFNAGTRSNVLASEAILTGTSRTFNPETNQDFPKLIDRYLQNSCAMHRTTGVLDYANATAVTVNEPRCSKLAEETVVKLYGKEGLGLQPMLTGGEDFSFFLHHAPGIIAFVGIKNATKKCDFPHHHGNFDIDEDALVVSTSMYAQYALDFLNSDIR